MVSPETVFVVAIVDCYFDRDGSINQTNHCGRNTNVIRVSAIRSTSKTERMRLATNKTQKRALRRSRARVPWSYLWRMASRLVANFTQQHQSQAHHRQLIPVPNHNFNINITRCKAVLVNILTFRYIPNSFIESTMLRRVSIDLAFSPIMVLWNCKSRLWCLKYSCIWAP